MTDNDKDQFLILLAGLKETLGGEPLSKEATRGYWIALCDLSIEQLLFATTEAIKTATYFPKPAELRKLAGASIESQIIAAWEQLNQALNSFGSVHGIIFEDQRLAATVRAMGGLRTLARQTDQDFATFGWHRFKEIYQFTTSLPSERDIVCTAGLRIAWTDGNPLQPPRVKRIGSNYGQPVIESSYQRADSQLLIEQLLLRGITTVENLLQGTSQGGTIVVRRESTPV